MKLLWLCNMVPGAVKEKITGKTGDGGLWVDHVLLDLRKQEALTIRILCPGEAPAADSVDARLSFGVFTEGLAYEYSPKLENSFLEELKTYCPDVIHIWGTEYAHTLAMVNAAEKAGMLHRVVVSIQGLCSVYAGHYTEGLPYALQRSHTFRDLIRRDNILQQQKKFVLRGRLEEQALKKVSHVIGRTDWDRACAEQINPEIQYHFCNETLRAPFYDGHWQYDRCKKHSIFASSCVYPIKGFHYLLEAFALVRKTYPDATLSVPGKSFLPSAGWRGKLKQSSYQKYLAELAEKHGVADSLAFLGSLNAEEMKAAFLNANVFVLPSTIENSPNSLGEAMLLGVPCVAGDVGGVTTMLEHNKEGFVYQSTAAYMLANYIGNVFAMEEQAKTLGDAAADHAALTHDPSKNLNTLLQIYRTIAQ